MHQQWSRGRSRPPDLCHEAPAGTAGRGDRPPPPSALPDALSPPSPRRCWARPQMVLITERADAEAEGPWAPCPLPVPGAEVPHNLAIKRLGLHIPFC